MISNISKIHQQSEDGPWIKPSEIPEGVLLEGGGIEKGWGDGFGAVLSLSDNKIAYMSHGTYFSLWSISECSSDYRIVGKGTVLTLIQM